MAAIGTGVTGGVPNLLGSLLASARLLPENTDWKAFGTSHTPENCGKHWLWQQCSTVGVTPAADAVNEVQHLEISNADGGEFDLDFDGQVAVNIGYPATALAVQTALESLSNVDPGDIIVTDDYDFTFGGQYAGVNVPQIIVNGSDLTGPGPDPVTAVVTTVVDGSPATPEIVLDKPLNPGQAAVNFAPFLIEYNSQSCPDGIPVDWQKHADRAKRGLAVRLSNGLAEYLSSSTIAGDPNLSPSLPTVAEDITPDSGPGALVCSLVGLLEDAVACGANGELFIHAPAWTLPLLLAETIITQTGNVFKMGPHTVVLDQGYTNEGPVGSPEAEAGQAWFYVSGPIEYATDQLTPLDDVSHGVTPRLNTANAIAAQLALVRFDPCCVKAALVEICASEA